MKSRRIPAYTHHKPTGQARVRINGKSFYLGKYGSPESHDRCDSLIAELVIDSDPASSKTLTTVLAAWWAECQRRYAKGKGKLGVEHAASVLGHSSSVVTGDHYAAANRERDIEAVKLLG